MALVLPGTAVFAQSGVQPGARIVSTVSWVEEWDPATGRWVRIDESPAKIAQDALAPAIVTVTRSGNTVITESVVEAQPVRFIADPLHAAANRFGAPAAGLATFGPFRVIDERRAALVGTTDAASPQAFAAMLAKFPGLEVIEFVDAPGTSHDLANLRLGRAIRDAGLATHVPAGGSARSGAVELFLAGTSRTIAPGALFAVHSWRDEAGREPADFAPDAPENRLYLDYYAEMGMSADQARAFYAMTNSVPHAGALWLKGAEMARWIDPPAPSIGVPVQKALRLALARSGAVLAEALRAPLALRFAHRGVAPLPAPRLAYAMPRANALDAMLLDATLLDSGAAFP